MDHQAGFLFISIPIQWEGTHGVLKGPTRFPREILPTSTIYPKIHCRAGLMCLHFSPGRTDKSNFARFWESLMFSRGPWKTNSESQEYVIIVQKEVWLVQSLLWLWNGNEGTGKCSSFCRKLSSYLSIVDHSIVGKGIILLKETKIFGFDNHFISLSGELNFVN